MMIGIEPETDDPIRYRLVSGSLDNLQAGKYQVLLGHTLARELDVRVGDKVRLMVTSASSIRRLGESRVSECLLLLGFIALAPMWMAN